MQEFAPAKVNLFLHVGWLGPDGYHPLSSLAVFADVGDDLRAEAAERFSFRVEGEFAEGLGGEDNLVVRAVDALCATVGAGRPKLALTLVKRLPPASGLGGGTSDGAAALRLLRREVFPQVSEAQLEAAALTLGSDGPACLRARPVLMSGRGERLASPPLLPPLPAVLVNPRAECSTAAVYRAFDEGMPSDACMPTPPSGVSAGGLADWLAAETRNDLEAAAARVQPAALSATEALAATPGARLARISGSGATAFALFATPGEARSTAARLQVERHGWWTRACSLEGSAVITNP